MKLAHPQQSLGAALAGLAASALLFGGSAASGGQGISEEGLYTYWLFAGASNASWSSTHTFRVRVRGCDWLIEHFDVASLTNKALDTVRVSAASDGTNVYAIDFQSKSAAEIAWGASYSSVSNQLPRGHISIVPGLYPPPNEPVLQHIWLAMASGCAFGPPTGKAKALVPVDLGIFYNPAFACSYKWITNRDHPNLRSLIFTSAGYTLARTSRGGVARVHFSPPFDTLYTNTVVNWRATTNFGGVLLPTEVDTTTFLPAGNKLLVGYRYRCTVTNISRCVMPKIPPALTGGMYFVTDRRFMAGGHPSLRYAATNRWLPENDPFVLMLLAHSPKSTLDAEVRRALLAPQTGRMTPIRLLMLVILLLPFGTAVLWYRLKTKPKKPQTKEYKHS